MRERNVEEDVKKYVIDKKVYKKYFNCQIIGKKEYNSFCREKSRSRKNF